jgi:hypothetical protein
MPRKHLVQSSDDDFYWDKWTKAKQDHTGVGLTLYEDEFTKVPVVGDERALFSVGDRKDVGIRQTRWIMVDDSSNVVALVL